MKEESPRGKYAIILTAMIMTSANTAGATEITHIEEEGTRVQITDPTIGDSHLILIHGNEKHLPLTTELLLDFYKGSVQHTGKAQGPHNTTIEKSRVTGELTLMRPRIDLDMTNTHFKDSVINMLIIESHNDITVDKDSLIMDVLAGTRNKIDETVSVNNTGVIKGLSGVGILNNSGTVTLNGDVGDITNSAEGTIRATDYNRNPATVTNLINDGKIELNYSGLITTPNNSAAGKLTNNGSITMKSGWMGVGNGRTLENNGDIKLSNEQGEQESLIVLYVSNNSGTSKIVNYGRIQGDPAAIIAYNEDPLSTPDRVGHINNNGIIEGGIYTMRDTGDRKPLEVSNGINGYWSSRFDEVELHDIKLYVESKYYSITNDGHISTIQRPDGQPGKIETNKFSNNGVIDIQNGPLVIDGEYQAGTGARLVTGGALGGDETQLPTLTVHGSVTGETTHVRVDNMGGAGAATTDGILVVRADTVDGEGFTKEGRIVAGAYDYDLVRVESGDHTEWRLTSALTPVPPGPVPPVPPGPEPGPEPVPPVPPAPVHVVRPEAVTYAENLRQANTLFMTDSEQRRAVGEYTDPVTGRTETSSLWLSQTGGHSTRHDASGQLKSDYNRYTVQLGGTLLSLPAGDDGRLEAGVQAGYGHARGNTRSGLTGYRARGTVSGYSTGLYGTWRQHRDGQSGAYISTTLQYSWLKNQVKGDDLAAEKYDARGTTLSLEGGYDYAVWQGGEQNGDSLFIRPHAQVTRMGVKADEHREANGTRVRQQGDGSVFSRTGVRVWLDKAVSKGQRVQPFVETNWLHNTRDFCSSMDGVRDCQAGNRNQAEVLAGVRGDVSPDVAVTAQAGGRFGSQAGRDLAGTLNVSVKF